MNGLANSWHHKQMFYQSTQLILKRQEHEHTFQTYLRTDFEHVCETVSIHHAVDATSDS